ncbi:hypothetical protein Q9L42_008185 [Methylomarinum sp. Ch1-1]|uniref:Uncharacterized protein n=1 Tax=Methylomarinum roseum TaxID=3067653 RepID=A0AAU7NYM8_9GAMM|nr:hypothetical protein [Methylomarinum sp. Ch1-1]MDP4521802.1 hypothetical protein [Methylomarinum sp. Ch1-1]
MLGERRSSTDTPHALNLAKILKYGNCWYLLLIFCFATHSFNEVALITPGQIIDYGDGQTPVFSETLLTRFQQVDSRIGGAFALEQGIILTAMIVAALTVAIIERQFNKAALWSVTAGLGISGQLCTHESMILKREGGFASKTEALDAEDLWYCFTVEGIVYIVDPGQHINR